jgi:hypothetical protein
MALRSTAAANVAAMVAADREGPALQFVVPDPSLFFAKGANVVRVLP